MSDFHTSLDRALERTEGDYDRFVEAVPRAIISQDDAAVTFRLAPIDARDYNWTPRDTSFVDDHDPHTDWGLTAGWLQRWVCGFPSPSLALCDQELPAEGVE